MDFTIIDTSEGSALIKNSVEERFLAIDSGLKNRAFTGVDTSRLQSLPGVIVENGEIHNWKLQGLTEIDGKNFYYGPALEGQTLASTDLTPETLLNLTEALYIIKDRNFPVRHFSLSSVFLCSNGAILFFPPRLMEFLNNHRLRENSLEMVYPWNKPGSGGDKAKAFTLAALAYKVITGEKPFKADSEEEMERLMSAKQYASPLLKEPRLDGEFVKLIDQSFRGEGTLTLWRQLLRKWTRDGIIDEKLSEEEIERIKTEQKKREQRRIRGLRSSSFLNRNKNRLLAAGAVIIVLGLIIQAPLSKFLADPVTIGMSQKEVVALYYNCFKTLDTEVLEDTITDKAGKADINEISTVYVTTRVRTSYEGSTGLLDPEEWIIAGKNPVSPGTQVWGISDLIIKDLGNDTFEANYIKWTPAIVENPEDTTPLMPIDTIIRDVLHLSYIKDTWVIDRIERIKE